MGPGLLSAITRGVDRTAQWSAVTLGFSIPLFTALDSVLVVLGILIAVNYIGLLDEFAVFDRPLTAEEVGLLKQTPGLLAGLKKYVEQTGARDIVASGVNGYVVPSRSADALADVIGRVHASASLRDTLRAGAVATRDRFPTIEKAAAALVQAYERTAVDRKSS